MKNIFFLCVLLSIMCHASNKKYHYQFSQAFFPIPKGLSTEEGSYEAWWRLDYDKKRIFQRDENYSAYVLQAFGFTDLNGNRLASHKEKKYSTINLNFVQRKSGHAVIFATNLARQENQSFCSLNLTFDELAWDKAAWHYIAITWKKDKDYYILSLTCDNKTSRKKFIANDKKSLDDLLMSFGSVVAAMGSLDSVQLSNKALSQDKLDNNYKKGLTKNANLIFSKKGNDINKLKAIKLKQQDFVPIYQNKATKKLKVTSRGLIIKPSQEVKGKHSSKAAQFHHSKKNI